MRVKDIMQPPVSVSPDTSVRDVLQAMLRSRTAGITVVDPIGRPLGFIPSRNLMIRSLAHAGHSGPESHIGYLDPRKFTHLQRQLFGRTANEVMDREPVTISELAPILDAVETMLVHNVSLLPVLRGDRLIGTLSRTDVLVALSRMEEDYYTRMAVEVENDETIRSRVRQALHHQMRVDPSHIQVLVRDGTAYLNGYVSNVDEAFYVSTMAGEVPGVRDVNNLLLVEPLLA